MITSGVARRLPVAGLTRLTAAAARLRLLDQRHVEMLLDRISNVASHVRHSGIWIVARIVWVSASIEHHLTHHAPALSVRVCLC